MTELEELERRHRQDQAHILSLTAALEEANKKNVQLKAQVEYVKATGALRIKEAAGLIDALNTRIEFMVDSWQAQIRTYFSGTDENKELLVTQVEPFRPQRVGAAVVDDGKGNA